MKFILLRKIPSKITYLGIALLILLPLALSYGLQSPWLGFYLDDWIILEAYNTGGASRLFLYTFYDDRPLVFWAWLVGFKLLGSSPLLWQLWALGWRWLTAFAVWLGWQNLWPTRRKEITLAAILFAVYPIFKQQPTALTFSYHWIFFSFWAISLYLSLKAAIYPRYYFLFTLLALGFQLTHSLSQEFFLTIELIRPLALWMILRGTPGRIRRAIQHSLPHLILLSGALIWRFFIMPTESWDRNSPRLLADLFISPLQTGLKLFELVAQSLVEGILGVWYQTILPSTISFSTPSNFVSWALALITFALLFLVFVSWKFIPDLNHKEQKPDVETVVFSGIGFLLGIAPGLAVGLAITSQGSYTDRFGLAAMPFAALLTARILRHIVKSERMQFTFLCLMVALSTGFHFRNASEYRYSWEKQTNFYWQLHWRAPQIDRPTTLMGNGSQFKYMGGWANAAAINLMYGNQPDSLKVSYWYFDLYQYDVSAMNEKESIDRAKNHIRFSSRLKDSIVFQYEPLISNCLWLVNASDQTNPDLEVYVRDALSISNFSRIKQDKNRSLRSDIFGKEPDRSWCYYYQKAHLAEQTQDWTEILSLYEQARASGFKPNASAELIPFLKAAVLTQNWELAQLITQRDAISMKSTSQICSTIGDMSFLVKIPAEFKQKTIEDLGCTNLSVP